MASPKSHGLLLLGAIAIAACTHQSADRAYAAGDTMVPTLAVGARVPVRPLEEGPRRGTVIVFRAPERPDREYVKRVVGIAGDVIASSGNEIRINGKPISQCRVGAYSYVEAAGGSRAGELWLEAFDGQSWLVFHSKAAGVIPSGPWTVAPAEVFVLGDSRENSHDSRFWYGGKGGGVPLRLVVGAVVGVDVPVVPKGAEALAPALAACRAALGV